MRHRWTGYKVLLFDALLINISIISAYFLRFGTNLTMEYFSVYIGMIPFVTIGKIIIFNYFGFYKNLWKYAGIEEVAQLVFPIGISNGLIIIAIYFLGLKVPRSIYAIATFIDIFLIGFSRFGTRVFRRFLTVDLKYLFGHVDGKRTMIIGAGEAAGLLIQEIRNREKLKYYPVCAIDDNIQKIGKKINGVPVLGDRNKIEEIARAKSIEEIIISIPSIDSKNLKEIVKICEKTDCEIKIVPSINEIRNYNKGVNEAIVQKIRNIDINDILGRKEANLDVEKISGYIEGKKVLVTGGAGSIGSELCRQISRFNPKVIAVIDISEERVFNIMDEFKYEGKKINGIIANVRDDDRLEEIFDKVRPDIVFHAAAYKHVHFMEENPKEAIKNNVFGTLNVVKIADKYNVKRFIFISTDKAVNPTNVYGATKRIDEMIVQGYNSISDTEFAAVRFGNVLGSSGSVIPLFKKQIERGGPVTVTHPEIIRYFMTIPEAVQLVIQAGAMAKGGEIFILDMGEPVKIDELARELIRLSGFVPDVDIPIKYIGLRPGEKLYEELLMAEEGLRSTHHEKIYIAKPMAIDVKMLEKELDELLELEGKELKKKLKKIVPTYRCSVSG